MEICCAKHVKFTYAGAEKPVLSDVSFSIEENAFVLLCGDSGSGKTTLLRLLKNEIAPNGDRQGELLYREKPVTELDYAASVREIGYTAQNPDTQQVSEYVRNELAFLPQNLGESVQTISLKIAETVSFFGTQDLYARKISTLSGGEKQLVNLQSVFVSEPKLLLLDEPMAQLDPFSSERFLRALVKLHEELGVTILLSEHNIQPLLPHLTKVLYLENGICQSYDSADAFLAAHPNAAPSAEIPAAAGVLLGENVPKTMSACRTLLREAVPEFPVLPVPEHTETAPIVRVKQASFRYAREEPDVLENIDLTLHRGEIFTVVGANGSGKTTLIKLLSGEKRPYAGKVVLSPNIQCAVVPQNPQTCFSFETAAEILNAAAEPPKPKALFRALNTAPNAQIRLLPQVEALAQKLGIQDVLMQNPFDLSAGQQQRVAIAAALLRDPDLLLFDEPTKGLDAACKQELQSLLRTLQQEGKTVLLVTHDPDFAAEISDRCALLFDGRFAALGTVRGFLTSATMYTSAVARAFSYLPPENRPVSMREVQNAAH